MTATSRHNRRRSRSRPARQLRRDRRTDPVVGERPRSSPDGRSPDGIVRARDGRPPVVAAL